MTTLDYSNHAVPQVRPLLGRIAAFVNAGWTVGLVLWLIPTAQDYFLWNHWSCGTPAVRLEQRFFSLSPILIGVPVAGWVTARAARFAQKWARCGMLASIAAWAITAAFIKWGWMIQR